MIFHIEVFFTIIQRIWGVSLAVAVKPADDSDQISNKARHRTFHDSIIAFDDIFLVHSCYVLLVYGCKIGAKVLLRYLGTVAMLG